MRKRISHQSVILQPALPPLARKTYTIEEAAEVIGVGRNTIIDLIAERLLRIARGTGKRVLIPCVAVDEYLAS